MHSLSLGLKTMLRIVVIPVAIATVWLFDSTSVMSDDSPEKQPQPPTSKPEFVLQDDVKAALVPLFSTIAKADVSRVTVELTSETVLDGAVIDSRASSYQIASIHPDRFTIYLKEPDQRTRIFCDGTEITVALAPDAYYRIPEAMSTHDAVADLPLPMGPYPEPVLALSLAGVDPSLTFLGAMKSVEVVDQAKFRGQEPAVHLRGVQDDGVSWDFWISQGEQPKPLRLMVDLTEMLAATQQVQMPAGYQYQLRFDFLSWRMDGEVDKGLFQFTPPENATEYKSLDDYYVTIADDIREHPLLGKDAPEVSGTTLAEVELMAQDLAGKVVVLDFWATWCEPCLTALPIIAEVTEKYAPEDVVFYAVNVGEEPAHVRGFVDQQGWNWEVLLDPQGKLAQAFAAEAIPLTLVIGKTGKIESAHIGFAGSDALRQRLTDELDVLKIGGRIASAKPTQDKADTSP